MSDGYIWFIIIGMGLITYLERASLVLLMGDRKVPDFVQRAMRFVPPAVLSALFLPAFVYRADVIDISLGNTRLLAGLAAAVFAWRTGNILLTIVVGMGVLWLLQAFS